MTHTLHIAYGYNLTPGKLLKACIIKSVENSLLTTVIILSDSAYNLELYNCLLNIKTESVIRCFKL